MVFARTDSTPHQHSYVERIFSPGTEVSIDFRFKHSRVGPHGSEVLSANHSATPWDHPILLLIA